ncbi:hypothetical protein KUTeg_020951 [Tegillarca granosa]|uniref:Protein-serine O-palmitoleoyltransferase porcupine n=1 Tax=Tegillarca granosa TaxID=220873 RepID=A0ABQ9EBT8_TEGGR|nr:hypothetical protein KUTeg_020951 [Tegillarca granosa]
MIGSQIILSMKVIGLAFDISNNTEELPSVFEYLGYVYCVGTVIFGPWISYRDYLVVFKQEKSKFSLWWLFKCVKSSVIGLLCMTFSTCLSNWLILDGNSKWLLAYRDAQSFRFSHYFVSYISEASATLAGFGLTYHGTDVRWDLSTSKPYHIEIPRSIVEVVTNWNLPMHFWLKTCKYKIDSTCHEMLCHEMLSLSLLYVVLLLKINETL